MQKQTLSAEQVRAIVEAAGRGDSLRKKTDEVAELIHKTPRTLWTYLRDGAKDSRANFFLFQLAYQYEILPRPNDGGGAFIL